MMQILLVERFNLAVHRETKTSQGFAMVVAKNGLKIQPVEDTGGHRTNASNGSIRLERATMPQFADTLTRQLRQPVQDATGLKGVFNFTLTYTPDRGQNANGAEQAGLSVFTALQEQLGLRLEARKVPVEILVVDHCDRMPTEN
jgi:uncharacterized protein (TIGR03435 family)